MQNKKPVINAVRNRFLALPEAVAKGLEPEPKLSDFQFIKDLGSGSFGRVFLVIHRVTKVQYAIKAIDKRNKTNIDGKPYFRREIEIMYKIHHPNVVRLFGHFEDDQNCYFIMEYVSHGNLYNLLSRQKNKCIDPQAVASLIKDLVSAVYYLHCMDPPIIHRDIKPENALLAENDVAKLTDFGWSNYIDDSGEQRNTFCGTPIYLAPEMIKSCGHDEHVDIWCLGCLMFELLTGKPPFSGADKEALMINILHLKINWPRDMNKDAKDLITKILRPDPRSRISLVDMLAHPFFTKYFPNAQSVLVKPSNYHLEPYIISRDVPTTTYKVLKRVERPRQQRMRDISPVPMSRLHLEKLTNMNIGKLNAIVTNTNNDNGNNINNNNITTYNNNNMNCISSRNKDKDNSIISNVGKDNLTKDYDVLLKSYSNLQKAQTENIKIIDEAHNIIRNLQKEKEMLIKELDVKEEDKLALSRQVQELRQLLEDKESMLQSQNLSRSKSSKRMLSNAVDRNIIELEKQLEKKNKEISSLQDKLSNSNNTSTAYSTDGIEKMKKEMKIEREKYENLIKELNNEISSLKDDIDNVKEKEAKKYSKIITKYEHMLTLSDSENKKLKTKVKDLEMRISKIMLSK